ncbi:type II toxin-antitoxin system Phd/YefM family antitoxin [Actinacidiphila guanduensis]|uniref:Antitoxin YefM n=1 Tax=Actinacidiphila guanduensis TaxID=310781 RepID=A0A1H0J654_9ACTN|nr:type II toxin-antitoxin system prevent-host-death family antitoxin [Actinacidiphila guanduensis]SDO38970.1 antitoxin YefM [Actinacidiphila guanduensis]
MTEDPEETAVIREGAGPVVAVPLADDESLDETAHLLRSPANARRLLASIDRLEGRAPGEG